MARFSRVLVALIVSVVSLLGPTLAHAVSWRARSNPPSFLPATGHYYQIWEATLAEGEPFSWDVAAQFASSLSYLGSPGYAATLATEAEAQMIQDYNELRGGGYTGGVLDQGGWKWATGPEAGQPMVFLRPQAVSCGVFSSVLVVNGGTWRSTARSAVFCPACGPPNNCLSTFVVVEYSALPVPTTTHSWGRVKMIYR
ncbi:MAG: hypothetical protein ABL977_03300 [Candidatus Eisenbacteria bacterium]